MAGQGTRAKSRGDATADATPEMGILRAKLQGPIKEFMAASLARQGRDYARQAQDCCSVLCEELAVVLGCITDGAERRATLLQIIAMMPEAVEDAYLAAVQRSQSGLVQ